MEIKKISRKLKDLPGGKPPTPVWNTDACTILNTDSFLGNDNGGSDGTALAAAIMDTVGVDLVEGSYVITLTGKLKDNSGIGDLPISVSKNLVIVTPGCSSSTPTQTGIKTKSQKSYRRKR